MTRIENKNGQFDMTALGLFVTLAEGDKAQYSIFPIGPYRAKVLISLPPEKQDEWENAVCSMFRKIECGAEWPIRFEAENFSQFFSEDVRWLEKGLGNIPIYLYTVSTPQRSSFSENQFRRYQNAKCREAYARQGRDRKKLVPAVEGQLALF